MKKNFNQVIKAIDGSDFEAVKLDDDNKPTKEKEKITFKDRILNCLLGACDKDQNMPGKKKVQLFRLALKVEEAEGEVDYDREEINLIMERCLIFLPITMYGRLDELIEGKDDQSD